MRPYTGVPVQVVQNPEERVSVIGPIDYYLRDLDKAMARLMKGQLPDGSGTPIINVGPLSDIYLVLLGRVGNQVAHGGTRPSGTLTLASTLHSTKGKVYLGNAQQTTYDEVNERVGVNEPAPDAKVHITLPTSTSYQATGDVAGEWTLQSGGGAAGKWGIADLSGNGYTTAFQELAVNDSNNFVFVNNANNNLFPFNSRVTFDSLLAGSSVWTVECVVQLTTSYSGSAQFVPTITLSDGNSYKPAVHSVSTTGSIGSFTTLTFVVNTATDLVGVGLANSVTLTMTIGGSENFAPGFYVTYLNVFAGTLGAADVLQKWENPTVSNTLNYATDGAGVVTLELDGTPKFRVETNGMEIAIGSPASGMVLAATDTDGTVVWASASSLATRVQHRFAANGYFRPGAEIDGAYIAPRAFTMGKAILYRKVAGTGGTTTVDLTMNGVSMLSAPIGIAAALGASATAAAVFSTTSVAASARIAASGVANETGHPIDWSLIFEGA